MNNILLHYHLGRADSWLSASVWLLEGELCWIELELAEKMQLLGGCIPGSARAGTQQPSGRVCWEQLLCVGVRRDRELGHDGEQEMHSSLLHG